MLREDDNMDKMNRYLKEDLRIEKQHNDALREQLKSHEMEKEQIHKNIDSKAR